MSDQQDGKSTGGAGARTGNPIFYRQPEPLDAKRHAGLGLSETIAYGFAAGANAIPVHVGEFAALARDYPIVFVGAERPMPVAIVGIRQNENLFVEEGGAWTSGCYVPAYVRRYPFLFLRNDAENQLILCIDRASERVTEGAANRFFDGEEPTEFTKSALDFASTVQQQFAATEHLMEVLGRHDLLVSQQRSFELNTGEQRALTDYQVIDEARFNALEDDAFLALRKSGALGAIYCHLVSLNSWLSLVHQANKGLQQAGRG